MAQLQPPFSYNLPPLAFLTQPPPKHDDIPQEPTIKRGRYEEEWATSPSHSESETSGSTSAPESRASHHEDEIATTSSDAPCDSLPSAATLLDAINQKLDVPPPVADHVVVADVKDLKPLMISTETPQIVLDAKFHSYKQFEDVFETWKRTYFHPFRVASSETLKEPDGTINQTFRYRYVVYHCAHYGEPRMRGIGKRPNQSYLPCGCRAMLRVNYNFQERVLKITTLEATHFGHEQSEEFYQRAVSKNRGSMSPASCRRIKREFDSSYSSPLSVRNSASSSYQNSPASVGSPNAFNPMFPNAAMFMQHQQQLMNALMSQQKENMSQLASQQLQFALNGLQRPMAAAPNPAVLNILNCLSSIPFVNQPAHGLVAPPPAARQPQAMESASAEEIDVVNDFNLPPNLPAPRPVHVKAELDDKPPVLEAEVPSSVDQPPPGIQAPKPILATLASELGIHFAPPPSPKQQLSTLLAELSKLVEVDSFSDEMATSALPQLRQFAAEWRMSP